MRIRTLLAVVVVGFLPALLGTATADAECAANGQRCVLVPPEGNRIYHAAFPEFGGPENRVTAKRIRSFERLAGRKIAWAYFSNNWFDGRIAFPTTNVRRVLRAGRLPFIRMMARSGWSVPDPNYSMSSIIAGAWDTQIFRWCEDAAAIEGPLLVEFGTEVNGDWFPWNGRWNGGGTTTGYGDPTVADGPERFRDAYRRVVVLCRIAGAENLTWFYHADVGSSPTAPWNRPWSYYPGDQFVDWIGLSDYGSQTSGGWRRSFTARMDRALPKLIDHLGTDKPFAVLEFGFAEQHGDPSAKPNWIKKAFRALLGGRYPEIRAISWWHEAWRNENGSVSDLHIDSSRRALRAYRKAAHSGRLAIHPRFEERHLG